MSEREPRQLDVEGDLRQLVQSLRAEKRALEYDVDRHLAATNAAEAEVERLRDGIMELADDCRQHGGEGWAGQAEDVIRQRVAEELEALAQHESKEASDDQ